MGQHTTVTDVLDAPEFDRWRRSAASARQTAQDAARSRSHHWACFLAEQAAQLGIKAFLHVVSAGAWDHRSTVDGGAGAMTLEVVAARRRAERDELLGRAKVFAASLDPSLGVRSVVVFGSVARGDFNL